LAATAGGDGDGLLGAAGGRVAGRGEDLGAVAGERHRFRAELAADFAHDCGAGDAVVAVGVVGGVPAELVPGEFGALLVVGGGLLGCGAGRERAELQQGRGCARAVEVAVGNDRPLMGAAGATVVWVQVLDELGACHPQRDGPGFGVAVGVAGVVDDVAERDPGRGHGQQDGHEGAGGVQVAGAQCHPAGQFGHGRAVLTGGHDGGGQVVAEEHLAFGAGQVAGAVAPGGCGVGALAGAMPGRPGPGFGVGPVGRQSGAGVLVCGGDAGLQQGIAEGLQAGGGRAVGLVFAQGGHYQVEGVLGRPVGELVRAVLPALEHAEPCLVGLGQVSECLVQAGQVRGPAVIEGEHHAYQ
jgi:hypothetical protein